MEKQVMGTGQRQDLYQPASRPRDPLDVVRQLNDIKRVQRQNGTLKRWDAPANLLPKLPSHRF
eukprot:5078185-Amphidinium_carterae.1